MELNQRNTRKILFIVIIGIVVYLGLQNISSVASVFKTGLGIITPLLFGTALAYILNVPLRLIERILSIFDKSRIMLKIKRPISIFLTFMLVAAILFLVMFLLIPQLGSTFESLSETEIIPKFFKRIPDWVRYWSDRFPQLEEWLVTLEIDWNSMGNNIINFVKNGTSSLVASTLSAISSVFSIAFNFIIGLIFSIYALANKEKLLGQAKRILYAYLPEQRADRVVYIGNLSNKTLSNFITGQLTEAVIIGLLCFIGMSIFRFPFALMSSVLVGFTALIPLFGAFIGTAIGAFMILMINPMGALWFIVFILILQQIEGNLIYPRVVGTSVGLPAMWVLVAVTLGGSIMGLVGMLIFVPLSSVLYTLFRESVSDRLMAKRIARKS